MRIRLEAGKFYKTRSGLKVECLKELQAGRHGFTHVCIVYGNDGWSASNYQPDGRYFEGDCTDRNDIISEWTAVDELGIEYGQVVWVRDDRCEPWEIGHFVGINSSNKPYMATSYITTNGTLAMNKARYYEYIRTVQPSSCLSKHGSLEANHD